MIPVLARQYDAIQRTRWVIQFKGRDGWVRFKGSSRSDEGNHADASSAVWCEAWRTLIGYPNRVNYGRGKEGKKGKKAGLKAGLNNNINNRDFGKIGKF